MGTFFLGDVVAGSSFFVIPHHQPGIEKSSWPRLHAIATSHVMAKECGNVYIWMDFLTIFSSIFSEVAVGFGEMTWKFRLLSFDPQRYSVLISWRDVDSMFMAK